MAKYIGRRVSVGYGKESSRGTAVAADYWDKQASLTIDDMAEYVPLESAFGQIENSQDSKIAGKWAEGEVTAQVKDRSLGLLLLNTLGSVSSGAHAGETTVYDHTFTVNNTNQHQSLTINIDDPTQDYRYANGMIQSLDINVEIGKFAEYTASFMAQLGATATNTVSHIEENYFLPQHATFKHATNVAGLAGASAIGIKKFNIKIEKNIYNDQITGQQAPEDFLNQQFSVTGDIELIYQDEATFKDYYIGDTARAVLLDLVNTDVDLGVVTTNPQLQIELAKVKFTEFSRDLSLDGVVMQKLTFTGLYDATLARMIRMILTNTAATY